MAAFLDVCRFTPTLGGTTDWTVSAAVTGYQTPASAGAANGTVYRYRAESADLSQWEVGYGAYTVSGTVLARTTVLFNSLGTTAKINFTAVPQVAVVALKEDLISVEEANSFTTAQKAQALTNLYLATTTQQFLSGSGTYTTPANVKRIRVRLVGGGGGGGYTSGIGGTGGNTTFSSLTGSGGTGGQATSNGGVGVGGAASGGLLAIPGSGGGGGTTTMGGVGGTSPFGGAGSSNNNNFGNAAAANSGSGGAGAGGASPGGGGGGAGGYVETIISSPSATYSYAVGAGGTSGGTTSGAGGAGGSGQIFVEEYYF